MDTLQFNIPALQVEEFDSEACCGYTQITTFYSDFSIAEAFGIDAIKDTYRRAFKAWKDDYKFITEFVMVLNWKCWRWENENRNYSKLYAELFYEAQDWCYENLKGEALEYFLWTTD